MDSLDEDYATPQRLAIYLEIGWSDFLFGTGESSDPDKRVRDPNPLRDRVPPSFPIAVAKLAQQWIADASLDIRSFCDVGGATGRTVFEFDGRFPGLEKLVLVEPSRRFCDWAQRLLSSDDELPDVPLVNRAGSPKWLAAKSRPSAVARARERLTIFNGTLERFLPQSGFDLVTCLNVTDRHPCPRELVRGIGRLMNDEGLLILSCPFDFHETSTPNPDSWIDDLNTLFVGSDSWSHVGQDELFYEFRSFNRCWTRFSTQVVGKRWHARGSETRSIAGTLEQES